MSPEQARGDALDTRSDLFSVGSVMYAMCAGRPPFRAETPYGILRRITDDTPRPLREINPDIPDWLEAIIAKLHAKEAAQRFATSDELAGTLEQCLAHVRQPATAPLPESVTDLVRNSCRDTRTTWATRLSTILQKRGAAVILSVGAVAALIVALLAVNPGSQGTPDASAVKSSIGPQPAEPHPTHAWDLFDGDTGELKRQTEELTGRAELLWDVDSSFSTNIGSER
jgi:serine/threonine protein kinase